MQLWHFIITNKSSAGRNEANSDIDTGYTNVVAVALAKTAANYFVILISVNKRKCAKIERETASNFQLFEHFSCVR